MSKNKGGLGFRNIHGFNIALLSKQCWKLIKEPTSLISRVLKGKYYPDNHYLQAERKGGTNYTWSGICEVKEEIEKGLRWVVGNGKDINIGSDKWLRSKQDFYVDKNQTFKEAMQLRVCDFFHKHTKEWDENKLRKHFSSEDVDAILRTRIPHGRTGNRVAWLHSMNGKYTVKSGYYQWFQSQATMVDIQQFKGRSVL